jgi:hypothetical protein
LAGTIRKVNDIYLMVFNTALILIVPLRFTVGYYFPSATVSRTLMSGAIQQENIFQLLLWRRWKKRVTEDMNLSLKYEKLTNVEK